MGLSKLRLEIRSNIDHGAEWSKDNMVRAEIGGELDTKSIEWT